MIAQSDLIGVDTIPDLFREAAHQVRETARPVVVSQTVSVPMPSDPVALFAEAARADEYRVYIEQPTEGVLLAGVGVAREIRTDGPARFRDAAARLRELPVVTSDPAAGGPVYLGGFAFDDDHPASSAWDGFPGGLLVLPRLLLAVRDGAATLTLSTLLVPGADPDAEAESARSALERWGEWADADGDVVDRVVEVVERSEHPAPDTWTAAVAGAAADIRAGRYEKVVLARSLRLRARVPFDPAGAIRRLRGAGPAATIFAFGRGETCFLGATPERLVKLVGREVSVDCLAGSIARGATDAEDERLARQLLASAKDRIEHEVVVHAVTEALSDVCDRVEQASDTPKVIRSRNVQHLSTPLRGRLIGGHCVLDLVERLHPTPAVGGYPRAVALETIREREGLDRGWYAGPVGWVNGEGEGEFAVAIRSALVNGDQATLFAGAGIMADSNPESEYAETGLKLKPMLAALGVQ